MATPPPVGHPDRKSPFSRISTILILMRIKLFAVKNLSRGQALLGSNPLLVGALKTIYGEFSFLSFTNNSKGIPREFTGRRPVFALGIRGFTTPYMGL